MFSYMDGTLVAAAPRREGDELVCYGRWRARKPAVDQSAAKCTLADDLQLDQHGGIPVEMRNGEEPLRVRRQHRLLLTEVFHTYRQDRTVGDRLPRGAVCG